MEVERTISELYQVWPGEFVAARAAKADEARRAKDAPGARKIATLRRPTLAAWASNRFVRERPGEVEQLLALGESLREAHRTLDRAALRKTSGEQHRLITALAREAASLVREAGHPLSETVLHEVEQIFHTVLSDAGLAAHWATGRLVKAPETAVGFGPAPSPGHRASPSSAPRCSQRAGDKGQRERLEQARAAEQETSAEADRRDKALRSARETHRTVAAEVQAADRGVERLREKLQQAEAQREEAREAAAAAKEKVASAEHEARKARRAADAAARAVARLTR
ncbi:hypothetical protein AB0E08_45885 [Streptomyces sp. NPDC048281]|uniref:hypothetical protein n=1 Tax=Streptomyces sp. NPDC048281 TaxID=3154715 RepID=UPI003442ABA5